MLKKIIKTLADSRVKTATPIRPSRTVVFNHIPKTAGMSFHAFIRNNVPENSLIEFYESDNRQRLESLTADQKNACWAIVGHLPLSFFDSIRFPHPLFHLTVVREPIDRLVSYYHYIKSSRTHYLHELVQEKNLKLKEFLDLKPTTELDNLQVRYLSSTDCWNIPFGGLKRSMLEEAKQNLVERFEIVGVMDEFASTLKAVSSALQWTNLENPQINRTPERPSTADLDRADIDAIVSANQLDCELYEFARDLFHSRDNTGLAT